MANGRGGARIAGGPKAASGADARLVGTIGTMLLGVFVMLLGGGLIYFLVSLWPAVQAATSEQGGSGQVSVFGATFEPNPDAAILLLVVFTSALGSYVHAATSFTDYVGNRKLATSWVWWYILRIFIGTALAILFYFAVRGGFFGADTPNDVINPYGIAALAGLVGLFSKQATDKLREVFDTLFRVAPGQGDEARDDSITNPIPVLTDVEPPEVIAGSGELELVLAGEGFLPFSSVRVTRADAPDVLIPRDSVYVNAGELRLTLKAEDVEQAGSLELTVFNPEPGGGVSGPFTLLIGDAVEEAQAEAEASGGGDPTAGEGAAEEPAPEQPPAEQPPAEEPRGD